MLVDGAQSGGAIAVDATPLDFYTVSGQKWLCGPDATGGLYVRDAGARSTSRCRPTSRRTATTTSGAYTPKAGAAALRRRLDRRRRRSPGSTRRSTPRPHWALRARARDRRPLPRRCSPSAFTVVTAPGQATLVSFVAGRRPGRGGGAAVRAGRRRPRHAGHRVAARLLRLVDERRRPRAPARRLVSEVAQGGGASGRFLHREASRRPARSLRPGRRRRGQLPGDRQQHRRDRASHRRTST